MVKMYKINELKIIGELTNNKILGCFNFKINGFYNNKLNQNLNKKW
jgi:hypothetical protein